MVLHCWRGIPLEDDMTCRKCEYASKCKGKTDAWYERVAICVADDISEERAKEIACEEMKR